MVLHPDKSASRRPSGARPVSGLPSLFPGSWIRASSVGMMAEEESPPASSSSTSSERQQHPHSVPTDGVKVSARCLCSHLSGPGGGRWC